MNEIKSLNSHRGVDETDEFIVDGYLLAYIYIVRVGNDATCHYWSPATYREILIDKNELEETHKLDARVEVLYNLVGHVRTVLRQAGQMATQIWKYGQWWSNSRIDAKGSISVWFNNNHRCNVSEVP